MDSKSASVSFSRRFPDILPVCFLILFTALVRIASLEYIEIGGDSLDVWENMVNFLSSGHYLEWNHHTMRWAINVPLLAVLKIFGATPLTYYIQPVLFSIAASVLMYFVASEVMDRNFAVLSAVLLTLYPKMTTMGSQLWPGVYEMTWLLGCVLCLLVWRRNESWWLLALAGILAGCVWGSRVTGIYYGPGILALILIGKRRLNPVLVFSLFFFLIVGLEWTYFYLDTGNILGRIGVMTQTHVTREELLVSFSQYLMNFTNLIKFRGLLPVLIAGLLIGIWVVRRGESNEKCIAVLFLGGLFFNVYMISSLAPLKMAAPVGSRYLTAGVPYMLLTILIGLEHWAGRAPKAALYVKWILIIAFAAFTLKNVPEQNTLLRLKSDMKSAALVSEKNLPVLMRYNAWVPNVIEDVAMRLAGYERTERLKINEDVKMRKNARRMRIMLFGELGGQNLKPQTIDGYYYFFRGNSAILAKASKVAVSDFSRKGHKLLILSSDSLPDKIIRGVN